MNHLIRTCKHHWVAEENLHWGRAADRKPFAPAGTPTRYAPDTPVVGRHMRLELHFDLKRERVWGTTTHELAVKAARVQEIRLNARSLEIGAVRVDGRPAEFDNTGEHVVVRLARPATRGAKLEIALEHRVERPAAGLYFTNPDPAYPGRFPTAWSQGQDEDSQYYFPCLDQPNYKQSSEAILHVPRGMFALSNGELVAQRKGRGKQGEDLWHYRMELAYSTYLFSVVVGDFAGHRERWGKVDVRWWVQRGREAEGRNAFAATADILRFLSDFTGRPYPYGQYTQIAVPEFVFGGMENFTVTTQTDLTLHDRRAQLDFSSDDLVAHEAAHTWFGNLATARSWAHAWLHESFATYLEGLYKRDSKGPDEFDYEMLRNAEAYFREEALYQRPLVTHRYESPIDLFDSHLYPGGAVRLRHLHALLGEKPFRETLRRFLETHDQGLVETVDLARAVEEVTAENYDWWFQQWIHSGAYPRLEITFAWDEKEKRATLTVKQTQPIVEGEERAGRVKNYFRLPTAFGFHDGRRLRRHAVTVEGETSRFMFRLPARPRSVVFDPDFECPVAGVKFSKPQDLLLHQLEHAPRPVARIRAVAALSEKPSAIVVKALGGRMRDDPFWGVQQRIAEALAKIGGDAAREALIDGLDLPHPKARRAVIAALGHYKGDRKVAAALEKKARGGDPSYYAEAEVGRALGRCRAPRALALLKSQLRKSSHMEVIRSAAFDGLAELEDAAGFDIAAEGARYGAPAISRPAAIFAIARLGRVHGDLRHRALELLQSVAEHQGGPATTFRGKLAAIRALGRLKDLAALPILERVAGREADGRIVRLARATAQSLREEAGKPEEMHALREDMDRMLRDNTALRERLDALENPLADKKRKSAARRKVRSKRAKR